MKPEQRQKRRRWLRRELVAVFRKNAERYERMYELADWLEAHADHATEEAQARLAELFQLQSELDQSIPRTDEIEGELAGLDGGAL